MWKNTVQSDRPQMTIRRMNIVCWLPKATNTHSEYVIRFAFPLKQWLHERDSVLFISTLSSCWSAIVYLPRYCGRSSSVATPAQHTLQYYGPAATGVWRTHIELNALYLTRVIAGWVVETENSPSFMVFVYLRSYCIVLNVRMIMICDLEKIWMEQFRRLSEGTVDKHNQASVSITADTQITHTRRLQASLPLTTKYINTKLGTTLTYIYQLLI